MSTNTTTTDDKRHPSPLPSPGLLYAVECAEKLDLMARFVPSGILAHNVSNQLASCAESIRYEIEYLSKKGIQ